MLMMQPLSRSRILWITWKVHAITPLKLISNAFQKLSKVSFPIGLLAFVPALLTSILGTHGQFQRTPLHDLSTYSTGPNCPVISLNTEPTSLTSATLQEYASTLTPCCSQAAFVSCCRGTSKSNMATLAPELARASAIALPIPRLQTNH